MPYKIIINEEYSISWAFGGADQARHRAWSQEFGSPQAEAEPPQEARQSLSAIKC
jgi:hypothetical protein